MRPLRRLEAIFHGDYGNPSELLENRLRAARTQEPIATQSA